MDIQKEEQEQHRPDREAESEPQKPPYEKPVIMSLGEFARGWGRGMGSCWPTGSDAQGQCGPGMSAHGGCGGGNTANATCSGGSTAVHS